MNHPERIQPQLFGVDKIIEAMRLEPTKITRNLTLSLFKLVMRISTNLPMTSRRTSRKKLKLILGVFRLISWNFRLKVHKQGLPKLLALKAMRKSTDDLIAFGDEHNDTEMLELAKTGYAMKNASSVLLPHANEQIEWTNEEDGVARKLQELFL